MSSSRLDRQSQASPPVAVGLHVPALSGRKSTENEFIPNIEPELITYLRRRFPISLAPQNSLRDYDMMLGRQQVVEHLEALWEAQQQET